MADNGEVNAEGKAKAKAKLAAKDAALTTQKGRTSSRWNATGFITAIPRFAC